MGGKRGKLNKTALRRFRAFVRVWIRKNLRPLGEADIMTFEEWLASTHYTEDRKREIRRCRDENVFADATRKMILTKMNAFPKREFYAKFKPFRMIACPTDHGRAIFGPIIKSVENEVYKHSAFIKHVPVDRWAEHVERNIRSDGAKYVVSDYTAFESSFVPEVVRVCEVQLLTYMLKDSRGNDVNLFTKCLTAKAILQFQSFTGFTFTRASGRVNTSLGNGFTNLMVMLFACQESGIDINNVRSMVEGDDGLFAVPKVPDLSVTEKLGFTLVAEVHQNLNTASFCGLKFELDSRVNVTDPVRKILTTPWALGQAIHLGKRKRLALLRVKGFSLLSMFPACPILTAFGKYILRVTEEVRDIDLSKTFIDQWTQKRVDKYEVVLGRSPSLQGESGPAIRAFFAEQYKISPTEQLSIERKFDEAGVDTPIDFLDSIIPEFYFRVYDKYVVRLPHEYSVMCTFGAMFDEID
jgi:hypothetical protein